MSVFVPDDGRRRRLEEDLFERRIVVVSGHLDDAACGDLVARLLALDALGDEAISLRLSSTGGSLDGCLGVVDVLDALGVPVYATAVGGLEGAPIAILAAASRRRCGGHATFVLREEEASVAGPARLLESFAAQARKRHRELAEVIARRSPLDPERIVADLAARLRLDAGQARAYGLVDEVCDLEPRAAARRAISERPGRGSRSPSEASDPGSRGTIDPGRGDTGARFSGVEEDFPQRP